MSVYSPADWQSIDTLGQVVEQDLQRLGVGLTMGGEPTYVSATDFLSLQWRYQALGDDKRRLGEQLLRRLQQHFAPSSALLHYGIGKLYPGEPFPRWALGCFWREDGQPLWRRTELLSPAPPLARPWATATLLMGKLTEALGLPPERAMVVHDGDSHRPVGYVLPILPVATPGGSVWASCSWTFTVATPHLQLVPGQTPAGMRLPLGQLRPGAELATEAPGTLADPPVQVTADGPVLPDNSIQVALCLEVRHGLIHVFMPPLFAVRGYVDLLGTLEQVAATLQQPLVVEGYRPPLNQGIQGFQITPDPGVLEVNIHPASSWAELVDLHTTLDQAAAACGLATLRQGRDGCPLDTGGGAHITLGAKQPHHSPLLRRPDLLRSFVTYWQHHPSLSYLFAGQFVGPTSQSPRVDEAHPDDLEPLAMAFALLDPGDPLPPEVVDHLLHHLLVDVTGNTHRAAFCIDKLFPENQPQLHLGLLELRGFAMPPEVHMRLLQMLLVRACVAWFWQTPYGHGFTRWGTALHDRFLLPHYIEADMGAVVDDLNRAGYGFEAQWFTPFLDFRCPIYGQVPLPGARLELRRALDPWPVLANQSTGSGSSRPVDDTTERLQVRLQMAASSSSGEPLAPIVLCNGQRVPLHPAGQSGQFIAGLRYRARSYTWAQISSGLASLSPQQRQRLAVYLEPQTTLRFELFVASSQEPLGGCLYQVQSTSRAERVVPLGAEDCRTTVPPRPAQNGDGVTFDLRDPRQADPRQE
jgi:uncharacterized protein (DUF2126 family)